MRSREVMICDWNILTIYAASIVHNLEIVKYCVEFDFPMKSCACSFAAAFGRFDVLWSVSSRKRPSFGIRALLVLLAKTTKSIAA